MRPKFSADDIMEVACEQYCRWVRECEEEELEAICRNCKLNYMVRLSVRN